MTSKCLRELKRVIQMAFDERVDIEKQLNSARSEQAQARRRYESWAHGFVLKRIFKRSFEMRKSGDDTANAKVAELEEQLRLTKVATQIEIDKEQAEPYFRMRDDFAGLSECAAIWDIKSHHVTDMVRERTTARMSVARQSVKFGLDRCDLIHWEQQVPHLQNAKGGDLYLYPGFIVYRAAREAFSVIDYHEVKADAARVRFEEAEQVPPDSQVVGQAWAKANKDGSRDHRFVGNYQIPVALYGQLDLRSDSGLWEEFSFSNPERMERFLDSYSAFVRSFQRNATPPGTQSQP